MLKKILKFRSIIESLIELQIYDIVSRKRKVWKDQIYSKIDEKERERHSLLNEISIELLVHQTRF